MAVGNQTAVVLQLLPMAQPSTIDNNDFSLGSAGWNCTSCSTIAHTETTSPTPASSIAAAAASAPILKTTSAASISHNEANTGYQRLAGILAAKQATPVRRLQADIDTDLVLTTSGAGAQYLSRTFVTPAGVTSVSLRYMFVTREFPKYYASQYNDAFSVTITSASAKGVVAFAASTLNAFAYNEYTITDLGGATS
uniref:Uncharacterized protein n=1 Tax=Tetradesmus obliquus TaxID=3088 RepID=A0A383W4C7_TETOB|eukprot:jgi/Sobl393_1/20135/SZX72033.1